MKSESCPVCLPPRLGSNETLCTGSNGLSLIGIRHAASDCHLKKKTSREETRTFSPMAAIPSDLPAKVAAVRYETSN